MKRPVQILEEKADCNQIEENADCSPQIIMALSVFAVDVIDRDFADGSAIPTGQCGNESVQFTVKRDVLNNSAAICLERRAEIVNIHSRQFGHHPVGAP